MSVERIAPELTELHPLGTLTLPRGNAHHGDLSTLREILSGIGQTEPLVINRGTHTRIPREIVWDAPRALAMISLGWEYAAVQWVDVPDTETLTALAVELDRTEGSATRDDQALAALVATLAGVPSTGTPPTASPSGGSSAGSGSDTDARDHTEGSATPAQAPTTAPADQTAVLAPPSGSTRTTGAYAPVSWSLTTEQAELVRSAVGRAQRYYGTDTGAEALVAVCERFNRELIAR